MHLLSTRPGGHVEDDGLGVVRVAQTPGDIVVLTVADTTLSLLAEVASGLPDDFRAFPIHFRGSTLDFHDPANGCCGSPLHLHGSPARFPGFTDHLCCPTNGKLRHKHGQWRRGSRGWIHGNGR